MAYSPSEKYPGAVDSDPNYKGGKFRDNNPSTTNNGSPLKAIDRNELLARDEAIMNDAGFDYNGLPDTPQDSQLFKAYKASLGNGSNLLSNHNFLIPSPDDSQPAPSATPTSYPPGFQVFSGVFANETIGISNLTYIDGRVSFSGGDLYFAVPNTGGLERINVNQFVASVADFDGKPRTRGVSFALVGDEYRVTVGIDALEDESANETLLGSVKFEQGITATRHEVIDYSSQSLKYRVGYRVEIHSAQIPDWMLKADGSIVSRTVDDLLWDHASNSGLIISQALKDADPEQYAMYYGDGDGSTTFSLPNWYLGHFARGNPSGVALGDTLGDAIRNFTGSTSAFYRAAVVNPTGVLESTIFSNTPALEGVPGGSPGANYGIDIDVSRQVPTADENRPKSGHINVCIERGKIPL